MQANQHNTPTAQDGQPTAGEQFIAAFCPNSKQLNSNKPPRSLVHYVETHLRIPYRHDVKDPASLAEYVQKIEAHLSEQAEMVEGWADEREVVTEWAGELEPTLEEYLRNEIYAQMDSLAALLVVVEKAGYGEMAEEIIWAENSMEQAAVLNGPRNNPAWCQMIIADELWGQEPPVMSDRLQVFASLRTAIGMGLINALRNERDGVIG